MQTMIIGNYVKVACRNLAKKKWYALINIFGLAIGMAACFFIFQYVHFESGYDRFNKNADRIFRIPIAYSGSFANVPTTAANHPALGPAMKAEFPEIEAFTRVVHPSIFFSSTTFSHKDRSGRSIIFNEERTYLADSSFFSMFTYPLISGNPSTALVRPNSMVISKSTAEKHFGKENPIGKTMQLNGFLNFQVTGVFKDVPENSHLKFDILLSFSTLPADFGLDGNWAWPEYYNYVMLAHGADPKKIASRFPAFIDKHLGTIHRELKFGNTFSLQPLTAIHLDSNYLKEAETNGSRKEISLLSIIGVFILVIAWINYVNLSTARSLERGKEVGLRKVVGARRTQLMVQFLFESVLINFLAFLLAAAIVIVSTPLYSDFIGKNLSKDFFTSGMGTVPLFWITLFLLFTVGALLVGTYPALILSSFKPVAVLKGIFSRKNSNISLRRVLVSFQFILSIILIAATIIVSRQLSYMRNHDLGYKKDQVLVLKGPSVFDSTLAEKDRFFRTEMARNTFIQKIAPSSDIPGRTILSRNSIRRAEHDKTHNFVAYQMAVNEQFFKTFEIEILKGRNFTPSDTSLMNNEFPTLTNVLVNEEIVKALGYSSNEDALHKNVVVVLAARDVNCRIIGVVKNYHQRSLKEKYDPIVYFSPARPNWKYYAINIETADLNRNMDKIENVYKSSFPGNSFEHFFLDDYFNQQYQADSRLGNVFALFASLAIVVACLGLLGLSSFVIRLRTKEIGIRKVLGASLAGIIVLFSRDFIKLVLLASLIAVPVIYIAADTWLMNYAFRMKLSWYLFLIPPIVLSVMTLLIICMQSLQAGLANPVKSLREQ
jgi:putative ABC transport system permease protein